MPFKKSNFIQDGLNGSWHIRWRVNPTLEKKHGRPEKSEANELAAAAAGGCLCLFLRSPCWRPAHSFTTSAGAAAALIKERGADPLFTILDVRTAAEFAEGRIKGALNVDIKAPDFKERIGRLDRNGVYLAVCRGGMRSARAVGLMKEMGSSRFYNLAGGTNEMAGGNLPLESAPGQAAAPVSCGGAGPGMGAHSWLTEKGHHHPFRLFRNHVHVTAEFAGAKSWS